MIKKEENYSDEDGKTVTAYVPVLQDPLADNSVEDIDYEGTVGVRTPMGIQPIRFPFPKGYSLEDCFGKFEEVAETELNRMRKEAEEKQKEDNLIITPGQAAQQGTTIQFPQG